VNIILAQIGERGAGFRALGDTWADTTKAHGRLILTVLGGLAEFERELIRARTGDGRAKANGVKMGASGSSPSTKSARRSSAVTRARTRLPTSAAVTTCRDGRLRDSEFWGVLSSRPLEITHGRASYAVVLVGRVSFFCENQGRGRILPRH